MTTRTRPAARRGFSLIELLVVISIIGILSGLLLAGVSRVRVAAQRTQASADIAQLGNAIAAFKAKFNVSYIPDTAFNVKKTYATGDPEVPYLKLLYPNINLSDTGLSIGDQTGVDGNKTLVFFLGGPGGLGFSSNRAQPFASPASAGESRTGPFFDFQANRLDASGRFTDRWGTPFAYFTSKNGNDYTGSFTANSTTVSPFTNGGKFEQMKGFQLISAGPNGRFGPGGAYVGNSAYTGSGDGADDISNFAQAGNLGQ